MRRAGNLWPELIGFANLLRATHKSARGKRYQPGVLRFHARLESNLLNLQDALGSRSWRPGAFREFILRDPKVRRICAAPYGQGQRMVLIPGPVEFLMGSPASEIDGKRARPNELQHRRRPPRSFAVASKAVTVEQFQHFLDSNSDVKKTYQEHKNSYRFTTEYSPDPQGPMISVTWFEAAQYCRWLSEREKIDRDQMCYPCIDQIRPGMMLPANCMERTGYRLPTEVEWEYACRAGARTIRYYGSSEDVLGRYAWYAMNSGGRAWPVGQLKPNDLGLFDMHGNAWSWCHDRFLDYPKEDDKRLVNQDEERMIRGGSLLNLPPSVRAAYRSNGYKPDVRETNIGFRVARTCREP